MEMYKLTGSHPLAAPSTANDDDSTNAMTTTTRMRKIRRTERSDSRRMKVFIELRVGDEENASNEVVVIEVFDDEAPTAARALERIARCDSGAFASASARDEMRVVFGFKEKLHRPLSAEGELTHAVAGAVGLSRDGAELSACVEPLEALDDSHQCVGRVASGMEFLRTLVQRGNKETKVRVVACGVVRDGADVATLVSISTKARAEAEREAAKRAERVKNETPQETMDRLSRESARRGVELAAMVRSRASASATNVCAKPKPKSKGMLDSVLGDDGSDSESD